MEYHSSEVKKTTDSLTYELYIQY